jgi:hypothetical protein
MDLVEMINKYGFPIVAAGGMGYMIFFVWTWATKEVKPILKEANTVLIALIDRIRMLDNDLIRLNQKVDVVLHLRGKTIDHERVKAEDKINQIKNDDEEEDKKPSSTGKS